MREALCCAAKARAAAPPPPDFSVHSDNTADHQDARAALLHAAAVVVNLHAQAVSIHNIQSLTPVVLDLSAGNYNKWHGHFLITLGKFALSEHVLSDDPDITLLDWSRIVCVVLSWLYGTISADLVEIVMAPATTARIVSQINSLATVGPALSTWTPSSGTQYGVFPTYRDRYFSGEQDYFSEE